MNTQYVAGFLDGEGYFGIFRVKRGKKTYWSTANEVIYRAVIETANTNKEVIDALHEEFGGYLKVVLPKEDNGRKKVLYAIRWDNQKMVKRILDAIAPFSVVKKRHIEILSEFLETFHQPRGQHLGSDVWENRKRLYEKIGPLNIKRRQEGVTTGHETEKSEGTV